MCCDVAVMMRSRSGDAEYKGVKAEEEGRVWFYTQWYWKVPPSGCWPSKAKGCFAEAVAPVVI